MRHLIMKASSKFSKICDIGTVDYRDRIFFTFDMDWCSDEILDYTLDIIDQCQIKCSVFVTNKTILLDRMLNNDDIELAIHPNFNFLLNGEKTNGSSVEEVIKYYITIIPNPISVRAHSLVQGSQILDLYVKYGLIYDCNLFIPWSANIELKPFYHWNPKLIRVPYFWEDDIHLLYNWEWEEKVN